MERSQMTFYASFWGAINSMAKKDQLPVFRAVIAYGLNGCHEEKLSVGQEAFFSLMKPVLDSSRKKAANGKQGGSKPKANGKQNASENEKEKEIEVEVEKEVEIENECYRGNCGGDGGEARAHEASDVSLIGLEPGEFLAVTAETIQAVREITAKLIPSTVRSAVATDCRNVFIRSFLYDGKSYTVGKDRLDLLRYAFDEAAIAGKPANWGYISGILDRLAFRGITNLKQAREYDENH